MASSDHLDLRPADPLDARSLAELHRAARAAAGIPTPYADHEVLARVRDWLAGETVWVAEDDAGLVGYARWTPTWLDDLYVRPDRWRHGVGTALLGLVQGHLRQGFGLYVFAANTRARTFYARHGLVEVARHTGDHNAEGLAEVELRWPGPLGDRGVGPA